MKRITLSWKNTAIRIAVYALVLLFLIAIKASTPTFVYQAF